MRFVEFKLCKTMLKVVIFFMGRTVDQIYSLTALDADTWVMIGQKQANTSLE